MLDDSQPTQTDIPVFSPYKDVAVNGTITLYNGPIRLEWSQGVTESEGSILLTLQGTPRIRFDVSIETPLVFVQPADNLQVASGPASTPVPFLTSKQVTRLPADKGMISGVLGGEGLVIQKLKYAPCYSGLAFLPPFPKHCCNLNPLFRNWMHLKQRSRFVIWSSIPQRQIVPSVHRLPTRPSMRQGNSTYGIPN